jgi:hypothetical protein
MSAALPDRPLELLTGVCQQLDLLDLARVAEMCKRVRHGDGGLETVELPTKLMSAALLLDLPLELLTGVCQQLDLHDLVRIAATCKRFRHGDGGSETLDLPTKSPVVMALRNLAFPRPELIPNARPRGCSESWVAYVTRCVRQRRCREAPPIAAGEEHSLFVGAAGLPLACGYGSATGHGNADAI